MGQPAEAVVNHRNKHRKQTAAKLAVKKVKLEKVKTSTKGVKRSYTQEFGRSKKDLEL